MGRHVAEPVRRERPVRRSPTHVATVLGAPVDAVADSVPAPSIAPASAVTAAPGNLADTAATAPEPVASATPAVHAASRTPRAATGRAIPPVAGRPAARRRGPVLLAAIAAPVALLASQLTLPAFADTVRTPVVVAAPAPRPQSFTAAGGTTPTLARDGFTIVAAPKPRPVAAASQTVIGAAVSGSAVPVATATPGSAQAIAAQMVAARGWGTDQFACLVSLWNKESGWRTTAANPSGAYGIPQSLPGSKMATAGADWQTNPATQITWGLNYIAARYGEPCAAWAHSEAVNSY